jgi:hypothetical protein
MQGPGLPASILDASPCSRLHILEARFWPQRFLPVRRVCSTGYEGIYIQKGGNGMKVSIMVLIASLLLAVGGWLAALGSWHDLMQPGIIAALLSTIGGVILAWLGRSPINSKQ